ncbi:MAG: DUF1592 domain-containing protein [Polyangiales bacterium]
MRALRLLPLLLALACSGSIDGPSGEGPPGTEPPNPEDRLPELAPGPAVLARLTGDQYRNTLTDLLGAPLPALEIEPDTAPYLFFHIGAASTTLSERGTQLYEQAAHQVVEAVLADPTRRASVLGCEPTAAGDACLRSVVETFGARAFRRPLTEAEVDRWLNASTEASGGDVARATHLLLAGMLQAPSFLYRVEVGEPDPARAERRRYTSYEMASRLSYLLWNTMPDAELLDAAARDALTDEDELYAQAARLLDDARARKATQQFFAQYLDLGRLDHVERDPARYPGWTESMVRSMRTEIELVVDDLVFRRDADVRDLFSAPHTFVNAELASLYGIDAPGASDVAFVPYDFDPSSPRAGVLTTGAFLAMNAHPTETSPTLRGKFVRERVLCQTVPPPPDNVNLDLSDPSGTPRTLRERLEQHRRNPECAACHADIDPPGMLFEHFDSVGVWREEEEGGPVDSSGDLDGTPLDDARDLATVLADDARVPACMVKQLYRHASGRLEVASEARALRSLTEQFEASGYRFRDLLLALATSESFRTLAPLEPSSSEVGE